MSVSENGLLCRAFIPALPPSVNHIWRQSSGGKVYKPKSVTDWQESAVFILRHARRSRVAYDGRVYLRIELRIKNLRRTDIDNRIKTLQDCLSVYLPPGKTKCGAEIIVDDSQVWKLEVERRQIPVEGVLVEVWAL